MLLALGTSSLFAQTGKKMVPVQKNVVNATDGVSFNKGKGCLTKSPDAAWENQFQALIAERNLAIAKGQNVQANYTIPVVIHIIHGGQTVGTYPNLSVAQATSQVTVLNNDYAGIGLNANTYPSTAFTNYATAAGLPAANKDASGRVKISNFNINFCLAAIDKNGATMAVAGIDRVNYSTFTLTTGFTSKNPADASNGDGTGGGDPTHFMDFINTVVKPQTIWDPTKYLNIWVTDVPTNIQGILGFATFPAGSGLTGLSSLGTATTDGLWCWGKAFGTTGTLQAGVNKGRTSTHEIGHWLGLRHIGGDQSGGCGTDYCADTPKNKGGTVASGTGTGTGQNYGTPTYPYQANTCTGGVDANVNGDMFMNFMDYTDDIAMYMFTEDQRTRAQTAMANGTYRKLLGTHGLCSVGSPTPATALFTMTTSACNNTAVSITNSSTGNPTPTYTWVANPSTGVTISPNANSASPTITFANAGSYVITLSAQSGTTAVSTKTNAITITTCTQPAVCNVTLSNIATTDTLYTMAAGSDTATPGCSPKAGYVYGSNCYDDLEKASFFDGAKYNNIAGPYITGAVVVFYKSGNTGTTGTASRAVNLKMYNGTVAGGPTGTTTPISTATANIGLITAATATNNIGYLGGDPTVNYATNIAIPYKYTFPTPAAVPASGFFLSVTLPTTAGDTAVVMNDFYATAANSWELWSPSGWHDMTSVWGGSNNMAIFPIITCSTKLTDINTLTNNVSVMPNPSTGIFNVVMSLPTVQDVTIEVTNMLGQTVYTHSMKSFSTGVVPVDLSDYNQGVYFMTVSNGKEKNVQRIVVTR